MLLNFLYIKKEKIKTEIETSPNNVPEVLWLHSIIAFISFRGGTHDPKQVGQSGHPSPDPVTLVKAPHVG